ncbi:MAG: aldo/keto reductase [Firmicutes bacterium]|nr:aldo/keto reductase [Bacillota bacterium]
MTISQLAFTWMLSKGDDIITLVGARKVSQLQEAIKCLNVSLDESDIKRIEGAIPENEIAGGSFPEFKFRNGLVVRL